MDHSIDFIALVFFSYFCYTNYKYYFSTNNIKIDVMQEYVNLELYKRYAHTRVPKR